MLYKGCCAGRRLVYFGGESGSHDNQSMETASIGQRQIQYCIIIRHEVTGISPVKRTESG
jgi:hypothetical protein